MVKTPAQLARRRSLVAALCQDLKESEVSIHIFKLQRSLAHSLPSAIVIRRECS